IVLNEKAHQNICVERDCQCQKPATLTSQWKTPHAQLYSKHACWQSEEQCRGRFADWQEQIGKGE
ncbi:MAG: hypothetical protein OXC72_02595, partial [Roseovarius sp.]|nr:hypothetical protein [Roseovarius sp.]